LRPNKNICGTLLERITSVIQILAECGLAFRGSDETIGSPHNENYLGLLELIAKFDIFLAQRTFFFDIKAHAK
jgi:hypothetical protein